jgi:hypothetical protein
MAQILEAGNASGKSLEVEELLNSIHYLLIQRISVKRKSN